MFRQAMERGERPAIEDYAPPGDADRGAPLLLELIHEDMEFAIKAGEAVRPGRLRRAFPRDRRRPDLALVRADRSSESSLRRRLETEAPHGKARQTPEATAAWRSPGAHWPVRARRGRSAGGPSGSCTGHGTPSSGARWREAAPAGVLSAPGCHRAVPARGPQRAGLRHPHIVAVHDVGQSTASRTWSAPGSRAATWPTSCRRAAELPSGRGMDRRTWPMPSSTPTGSA